MRQKLWRKKKFVVMAAAFACIAALSACGKKDTDYNVDVGNGDGGSVQSKYSIPESCDTTFDAGSTGLKEIRLTDSDITVPNTGAMYVAPVKMKEIDPEYRKNLVEKLFDTDKGVYVYYDMENMDKLSKLDVLNTDFSVRYNRNPIEFIQSRIKKPVSIATKLSSRGCQVSVENIVYNLNDVAGLRVICSFIDDIYAVAEKLISQNDITLIEAKDYISHPKPNGYRSLHLIIEVPVFFADHTRNMRINAAVRQA